MEEAVISAIKAVEGVNLDITVVSAAPENFVSESEIAKRLSLKRQAVSLWVKGFRRASHPFPPPVLKLTEKLPLWCWHAVVEWLFQQKKIDDVNLIKEAKFIEAINTALLERNMEFRKYCHQLVKKLS